MIRTCRCPSASRRSSGRCAATRWSGPGGTSARRRRRSASPTTSSGTSIENMRSPREISGAAVVERLQDLALVDVDVLTTKLDRDAARELLAAYVSDLEEALGEARTLLREGHRELAAGTDPLALLD